MNIDSVATTGVMDLQNVVLKDAFSFTLLHVITGQNRKYKMNDAAHIPVSIKGQQTKVLLLIKGE